MFIALYLIGVGVYYIDTYIDTLHYTLLYYSATCSSNLKHPAIPSALKFEVKTSHCD